MRGVLKSRKLAVNSLCLVCELEEELVVHLFHNCGFSKQVLEGVGVARSTDNMQNSWKQWLVEEFMKASILECRKLAISFWALWYNRNKIYYEGVRDRVQDVVRFINAYLMEIDQLNNLLHSISTPEQTAWEPLEGDAIKFNFDASYS
ncbi:hypothetical protein GOBAR_AA06690 [Gossypium barbadense]|uniref:Reverse transcriptase zinc-binding domain-containing protein n=1 Tax=Gossypium barbadense TaxID=3634 RepID=A0A2P5YEC7_GOSBA|nr:hypothetical protein GOBAR_AA06690 [Gossypium barbadense]